MPLYLAPSLVIGGKSLGGRIASKIADETGVQGLVCLGYPFHPPGKPDRLLLSRRETLVSNRGTLSALIVTTGEPPAGYRFAITPDF